MSKTLGIEQLLPRPTFRYILMVLSLLAFCFYNFFPVYVAVKQTTVLIFHITQSTCLENSIKGLLQGHNNTMPRMGIKPTTL